MIDIYIIKQDKKGNYYIIMNSKKMYIKDLEAKLQKKGIKYSIIKNSMFYKHGFIKIGG